jgi:hypothetical protein
MRTILQTFEEVFPELPSDFASPPVGQEGSVAAEFAKLYPVETGDSVTRVFDKLFSDLDDENDFAIKPDASLAKAVAALEISADTEVKRPHNFQKLRAFLLDVFRDIKSGRGVDHRQRTEEMKEVFFG